MHEISLVSGILEVIGDEFQKRNLKKLFQVTICYGPLASIEIEALRTAFEIVTAGTPFAGAELVLEKTRIVLRCAGCGRSFSPEEKKALFSPCPLCGRAGSHETEQGSEMYIKSIEAE